MKNNRVLCPLGASIALVVGTRVALFTSVVIAFALLLRTTSHRGLLAVVIYLVAGVICTGYCSGRLLERLWIVSGRVSKKLWERPEPTQELTHG